MRIGDYERHERQIFLRLHEKGGKDIEVPAHHNVQLYVEEYLEAAGIEDKKAHLFQTFDRSRSLTGSLLHTNYANPILKVRVNLSYGC